MGWANCEYDMASALRQIAGAATAVRDYYRELAYQAAAGRLEDEATAIVKWKRDVLRHLTSLGCRDTDAAAKVTLEYATPSNCTVVTVWMASIDLLRYDDVYGSQDARAHGLRIRCKEYEPGSIARKIMATAPELFNNP